MDTRMIYGPFKLVDAELATVAFDLWNEMEQNDDFLALEISLGRFLAFYSRAYNLVQGDTNLTLDVFVRDLQPYLFYLPIGARFPE